MRRYFIRGGIILAALFIYIALFAILSYHTSITFLTWPKAVLGQTVFELTCPLGTSPVQSLQTTNTTTGKLRQNYCVDASGNVFENVTGTGVFKVLNNTAFAGNGNVQGWTGTDILGWIASAYAALPANGGEIDVYNLGSSCMNASTSITLATVGKYAFIKGMGASSFNASLPSGTCINFTPVTAVTAITIDWGSTASFTSSHGIDGIHFINNNCVTNGGCGSSAIGVAMGIVNLGAPQAVFNKVGFTGFGIGYQDANNLTFGQIFSNSIFAQNTVGLNIPGGNGGIERIEFDNDTFVTNGTAVETVTASGPVNMRFRGGSCDANTVICVSNTSTGITDFDAMHFENFGAACGSGIVPYVNVINHLHIFGGEALDDCNSNATPNTTAWFTANTMMIFGQAISAPTRTTNSPNHPYNCTGGACDIHIENINPGNLNSPAAKIGTFLVNVGGAQDSNLSFAHFTFAQATSPTCTFATGGGTGPSCSVSGSDSGGRITATTGTAPAASGTITLNFHSNIANIDAGNDSICVYTPKQGGAGQWNARATIFDQTSSATGDTNAWDNNAVALTASTAYQISYICGGR